MSTLNAELYVKVVGIFSNKVLDHNEPKYRTVVKDGIRYFYALFKKHLDGKQLQSTVGLELFEELLHQEKFPPNKTKDGAVKYSLLNANVIMSEMITKLSDIDDVDNFIKEFKRLLKQAQIIH